MGPLILQSQILTLTMAVRRMRFRQQQLLNFHYLGNPAAVVIGREEVLTCYIVEMSRRANREDAPRLDHQADILNLLSSDFVHFLEKLYNCSAPPSLRYTSAAFHLSSSLGAYLIPAADLGITSLVLDMQPPDIVNFLDVIASRIQHPRVPCSLETIFLRV